MIAQPQNAPDPMVMTHRLMRWAAVVLILATCVGCDQFTKHVGNRTQR